MTLLDKIYKMSYDMSEMEKNMEKCGHVSKTKKEINEIAKETRDEASAIRKSLVSYRSNLVPITAGEDGNTIHDEIMAICEDIGTAMYHLQKGEIREADKLLYDINKRTRGY